MIRSDEDLLMEEKQDSQSGNLRNDGDEEDSRKHDLSSKRFGELQIDYREETGRRLTKTFLPGPL